MSMNSRNNEDVKFIPIKLDDCLMSTIFKQTIYIDVYGQGQEFAIRQMIDIVNGNNTFKSGVQQFENIRRKV